MSHGSTSGERGWTEPIGLGMGRCRPRSIHSIGAGVSPSISAELRHLLHGHADERYVEMGNIDHA
jgi:hypothetical protein